MIPVKLNEALSEIQAVMDFMGEGEINVAELNRKSRAAEARGVGWPIALFPLLNDIERRSATL